MRYKHRDYVFVALVEKEFSHVVELLFEAGSAFFVGAFEVLALVSLFDNMFALFLLDG